MIFRELNNKLYEITLLIGITEDEFLEKQRNGKVKFIRIDPNELPQIPKNEKRNFSEIFYMFDNDKNIVIDYERTVDKWIKDKYEQTKNYIYECYPQEKQASDIADKTHYETLLKAKGITNLEQDIVNRAIRFYNGETIEEIIADVDDEDKVAYEQLLKVAIRTKFVQDCKTELKKAIDENREPKYPKKDYYV